MTARRPYQALGFCAKAVAPCPPVRPLFGSVGRAKRIASALNKGAQGAGCDLKKQLADVRGEIADIDAELGRTKFPLASKEDLAELRERRDTLAKVAGDIQAAIDKLRAAPDMPPAPGPGAPPSPSPGAGSAKGSKVDAQGYMSGLRSDVASPLEKIHEAERRRCGRTISSSRPARSPGSSMLTRSR